MTFPYHVPGQSQPPAKHKKAPAKNASGSKGSTNKKSKAQSDTFYVQPPFDPRISTMAWPLSGNYGTLKRGFMIWAEDVQGYGKNRARVNFLYNPSTIDIQYSQQAGGEGQSAALAFRSPNDKALLRTPMQQSVSFSLLYDRTFELMGAYKTDGTPVHTGINQPNVHGVGVDILAMKQFTGMLMGLPGGKGNSPPPPIMNKQDNSILPQGVEVFLPSWLYFGANDNFSSTYFGFVTNWDVQITHWTQYMVPMRCVINVGFALLPPVISPPTSSQVQQWWTLQQITKVQTKTPVNGQTINRTLGLNGWGASPGTGVGGR